MIFVAFPQDGLVVARRTPGRRASWPCFGAFRAARFAFQGVARQLQRGRSAFSFAACFLAASWFSRSAIFAAMAAILLLPASPASLPCALGWMRRRFRACSAAQRPSKVRNLLKYLLKYARRAQAAIAPRDSRAKRTPCGGPCISGPPCSTQGSTASPLALRRKFFASQLHIV